LEALGRTRLAVMADVRNDVAEMERLLSQNRHFQAHGGDALLGRNGELYVARLWIENGLAPDAAAYLEERISALDGERPHKLHGGWGLVGTVRLSRGDFEGAAGAAGTAVRIVHENLGRYYTAGHLGGPLELLAMVAAAAGEHAKALRLEAAALAFRERDA